MKVLITGGTGDIGKAVSKRLHNQGWDIKLIGLEDDTRFEGVEYARCDIRDFARLKQQMQGCEAVIHLAALRTPTIAPNDEVFRVNVAGTFNVYEAAAQLGIKRVVQASSINAVGCGWSIAEIHPQYFPIDEDHPRVTNDAYSLSKQMVEDIADYFYRRDGVSGTSLRFPWVYNRERHFGESYFERQREVKKALLELFNQPKTEQQARVHRLKAAARTYRQSRPLEYAQAQNRDPFVQEHDPLGHFFTFERYTFWTFLDDRDAAQAIEKSLRADHNAHHVLFVNDSHNNTGLNSERLLELFYPEVSARTEEINGSETLVSIDKARALIGFEPEFSVHAPTAKGSEVKAVGSG